MGMMRLASLLFLLSVCCSMDLNMAMAAYLNWVVENMLSTIMGEIMKKEMYLMTIISD